MSAIATAFTTWMDNIGEEVSFWHHFLATKGDRWPEGYKSRFKTDSLVDERLRKRIALHPSEHIRILDVGAGPLTTVGRVVPGKVIEITPTDPLADMYDLLLEKTGTEPLVRTRFADAENLSHFFASGSFEVVHCRNALDHSYDPLAGIIEMLKVVTEDGFVYLEHLENEADFEGYQGLHQWNFTEREGDFVIWSKTEEHSLADLFAGAVFIDTERVTRDDRDWIVLTLRRNAKSAQFLQGQETTIGEKFRQSLFRHFVQAMPEAVFQTRQAS